jgi:uncharacterized protein (TIGR01777 family)
MKPPKIVVAGASGFIGRPLCRALWDNGRREVWALSRTPREIPYARVLLWNGREPGPWQECLEGAQTLINLCGGGLPTGRWSAKRMAQLERSRLEPTRALVAALAAAKKPPRAFISASAVSFYGDRGEEALDEDSESGADFLAMLCVEWENEARRAPAGVRTVLLRAGLVLGTGGGTLRSMLLPFRLGLGGPLGDGRQFMSWIAREDVLGLIVHLLDCDLAGPVNATAPEPVANAQFARELAASLHRTARLRLPGGVVKLALGDLGGMLLGGQRALPRRAQQSGYAFKCSGLRAAIDASLS